MAMDLMGVINLYESEELLQELTRHRPLAALPFGGRYRLIDFVLSNMVNSGIANVGILFKDKYRSLMDHLRSGKEWDLARKRDGLVLMPPSYSAYPGVGRCGGEVDSFFSNLDYLRFSRQKYVVIAGSSVLCNLNYQPALDYHQRTGADVTVLYTDNKCLNDCAGAVLVEVAADGRVTDMEVAASANRLGRLSLGMYIMKRELLIDLIDNCVAHGGYDFVKHCLIRRLEFLKVFGFRHDGYVARISSLSNYFQHNMELLNPNVWQELFSSSGPIYTKVKDEPPSKYKGGSKVTNSLVAGGCIIEGCVENSILFRGVTVHKGAHIKNSIVMQKGIIEGGVMLDQVICDKNVHIKAERQLKGDRGYPLVVKKGMVV
ncbi:Glycogen biosynthesis protein GlgD [bioreactor metagenome]|uniref:Glycogen biosynthesis protein GlgD n=1 Tax=bioreactor metagenome TaxID=1076179 RepID=A0A644TQI7_9ZZZZ